MIFIYEDLAENLEPLSFLRPVCEIRCGALTFREKLSALYGEEVIPIVREELFDLFCEQHPDLVNKINRVPQGYHQFLAAGTVLTEKIETNEERLLVDEQGRILGFFTKKLQGVLTAGQVVDFLTDEADFAKEKVPGRRILYTWEIFSGLELEVTRDFEGKLSAGTLDPQAVVYGDALRLEKDAVVEAGTIIDCRKGPVTVAQGALLKGPNFIEGPCYIGPDTIVDSARLRAGTVLGPVCRVGGEVEACVFHGYVNKHHEGFMGHSYLGEWVNLGAMTTNSDLKNNYSQIRVDLQGEPVNTGLMKFGCVMGDHTKTAIGTLIPTGSIIGIFANLLGGGLCSKHVLSFSWNEGTVYKLDKLLPTAEKVMARRDMGMGEELANRIKHLYKTLTGYVE